MSIDDAAFAALRARVEYLERASGLFADDASLDRPKGDPTVRFAPRSWRGPDFVGKRYSLCSAEFLEQLAEALSWAADNPQPGKEQYAKSNRIDAGRARAWARRLRSKVTPKPAPQATDRPAPIAPTATSTGVLFDDDGVVDDAPDNASVDLFSDDPSEDEEAGLF